MVLTNKLFDKYSKTICDDASTEEGEIIAAELLKELSNSKIGVGLAAPQIGITKRVCVINVKEPLVLINPEIIESKGEFIFSEGCLSYPKKTVSVLRHTMVAVDADNLDEPLVLDIRKGGGMEDVIELTCVHHEIDHLNGITMFDRKHVRQPIKAEKKYGRNHLVTIKKGDAVKVMKYKKALPLINTGEWGIHAGAPII